MFQTFISRHNSNFFSDKLVLTSVTPASSAPVLQTPKATSSTLYFDSLTVNAGNGGFLHCIQMDKSVNAANQVVSVGADIAFDADPKFFACLVRFESSSVPTTLPTAYDVYPLDGRHDGGYYTVKDCVTIDVLPRTTRNNVYVVFFFQAEDGIRDVAVTGVQTCALPISFESSTGIGVRGKVEDHAIVLGNTVLLGEAGADPKPLAADAEQLRAEGASVIYLAVDGRLAGLLAVHDPIKESTAGAIETLHQAGIRIVMATGDGPTTAQAVARKLGIDEVHGEVRPQDKADLVARLQGEGRRVAMAGDGINDAPALARANVGIAMGTGTDVAMNSAQITLVKGDLRGIARARQLSDATVRNMVQNLLFALVYNALGVPIAAGVLYPFFGILLSPLIAAAAMSLSSVSVVGNALRLRGA